MGEHSNDCDFLEIEGYHVNIKINRPEVEYTMIFNFYMN